VLVSSADGVGTKLKIAFLTGRHNTIGEDLVNHCVNDIAVQGAVPLFFLDYFAVGKWTPSGGGQVVEGVARGCRNNGCALIGGETAEMPGIVSSRRIRSGRVHRGRGGAQADADRRRDPAGRRSAGAASNGLHTNGYSLARKLLFDVARRPLDRRRWPMSC
jgi:phosphoribosylformylglycinamidine cyclo-ligase